LSLKYSDIITIYYLILFTLYSIFIDVFNQYLCPGTNKDSLAALSPDPAYLPSWASALALALTRKASDPALTFASSPLHVLTAVFCKALPKEKVKNHGALTSLTVLIAFK
jgi:hypothetical protein